MAGLLLLVALLKKAAEDGVDLKSDSATIKAWLEKLAQGSDKYAHVARNILANQEESFDSRSIAEQLQELLEQ